MKLRIGLFLLTSLLLTAFPGNAAPRNAVQTVPKTGGVCFRFDDNQTLTRWTALRKVFDDAGFQCGFALNSHSLTGNPALETFFRELQASGYELLDHTPSHSLYSIRARNPEELERFKAETAPFLDHVKDLRLYFRYEIRKEYLPEPFHATIKGARLLHIPEEMLKELKETRMIYVPKLNQVYLLTLLNQDSFQLRSVWEEDTVNLPELRNLEIHLVKRNEHLYPPDDLLRFLARVSRNDFQKMGLTPPVSWVQPYYGFHALNGERIRMLYGREYGYTCATSIPGAGKTYCEPAPERCRFSMMRDDLSLEELDLPALKNKIADRVARHHAVILSDSFYNRKYSAGFEDYLKKIQQLLTWCREKQIEVRTPREWADRLYSATPDPYFNIIPPLTTDRDKDGIPDGFQIQKEGVSVKGKVLTIAKSGGKVLEIRGLGGVEKGTNLVSFQYQCGEPGTVLNLRIRPLDSANQALGESITCQVRTKSANWDTFMRPIEIPQGTVCIHIQLSAVVKNPKKPIQVKEITLAKQLP